MELQESRGEHPAMTFDEVSMERSKSFVKALQVPLFLVFVCVGFRSGDLGFCHLICFGVWSIFGVGFGLFCSVACVLFDNFLHGFAYECICSVFYFVC